MGAVADRKTPRTAAALAVLTLGLLAGCGPPSVHWTDGSASAPSARPPGSATQPSPTPSSTPSESSADDGDNVKACFDGNCEISVSKPVDIQLHRRFGVDTLSITEVSADGVGLYTGTPNGGYLQATVSVGGTAVLNRIKIQVVSIDNGAAILDFSPA